VFKSRKHDQVMHTHKSKTSHTNNNVIYIRILLRFYDSSVNNILHFRTQDPVFFFRTIHLFQSEKYQCRIDTVSSPDDGHIVARNM